MYIFYNVFQLTLLILLLPLLCVYILFHAKYRTWLPQRLGIGLPAALSKYDRQKRTIWIHALSVGEVTSALPLVAALREEITEYNLIFSASTKSGFELGKKLLSRHCDVIIPYPVDLFPVCRFFVKSISPDLFILVETDFWPNFLTQLKKEKIPAILVNGRISEKSMEKYRKYSFFFQPMFHTFDYLCVQTESDRQRFMGFGLKPEKVLKLGNLKYEPATSVDKKVELLITDREKKAIFIAGSTHPGEEEYIFDTFTHLHKKYNLHLIIAPRDILRAEKISALAQSRNISTQFRSSGQPFTEDLLILDTIGELTAIYAAADICFVGGSLVNEGGHNPLEPAHHGKPVIFGSHMSDFEEISQDLIISGGAFTVVGQDQLNTIVDSLLKDRSYREKCGKAVQERVLKAKGILKKHLELIRELL